MNIKRQSCNMLEENCYVVSDESGECVIIDCGAYYEEEYDAIEHYISEQNLKPVHLLATHGHLDHNFGNREIFKRYGLKVEACQEDAYLIEQMFKNRMKLSRMHIDKNYRIYLGDYMGMEISLTPLNKAVYFLFLRHPEGIRFKELSDHRQELMDIYSRLKSSFGSEASLQSIENLVNPFDNSINEKCARIREAFVSQFDEHMAQYYFITGQRGEPKGIKLPRKYVRWDAEIRDLFE